MGKRIQPRAKQHILRHACCYRLRQIIFGVAAAGDHKRTKPNRERPVRSSGSTTKLFSIRVAKDRHCDRIIENKRVGIIELMRGSAQSYPKCGF